MGELPDLKAGKDLVIEEFSRIAEELLERERETPEELREGG